MNSTHFRNRQSWVRTPGRGRLHEAQATTDVGEDVEKEDLFCTAGGNANWYSHSGKQYGDSSKN